jgi:hypothetical protein
MIGGDIVLERFLAEQKWRRTEDLMFPLPETKRVSFITAVMLLSKAQISDDPFCAAYDFRTGIIQALIIGLAIMLFTQLSMYVFTRAWEFDRAYSYSEVWAVTFGPTFAWVPSILLILLYWTYNFTASWEAYAYPQYFLPHLWPECPEILVNQWFLLWVASVVVVLPCSFARRFTQLAWLAYLSFFSLVLGIVCLILHFTRLTTDYGFDPEGQLALFNGDFEQLINCASNFNVGFFLHPFLAIILKDLECPSISRCMNVAWASNLMCLAINYAGGAFGYLLFNPDLEPVENIFMYLPLECPENVVGSFAAYMVAVLSMAYFALYNARVICTLVLGQDTENQICLFAATMSQVTAYVFSTYVGDKFTSLVVLLGNFGSIWLAFVFPPVFYLSQFRLTRRGLGAIAIVVLVVGVAFGAFTFYQAAIGLVQDWAEL